MSVALLHVAISQLGRLLAACLHMVRAFSDWYQRPSTCELRGLKLLREWLSQEQLAQYDAHNYFEVIGCILASDTGYAMARERTSSS